MASYLGDYPGCSSNRESKFVRATESFLCNTYSNKLLVIISDGCYLTEHLYNEKYKENDNIVLLSIDKQPLFSGKVRNEGLKYVNGIAQPNDVVCYLDTDDRFGNNHLKIIMDNFGENDFVIYDTYRYSPQGWYISKVAMKAAHIGTSSFAHKVHLDISWPDRYGHDWGLLSEMSQRYKYSIIKRPEYYIHHTPNSDC